MKIRIKNPIWGVPITFIYHWNPDQFKIFGLMNNPKDTTISGKRKYARILIQKKNENNTNELILSAGKNPTLMYILI